MTESGFSPDTRKRPPIEGKRHTWQKEPPQRDRGASLIARCVRCGATRLTERAKTRNAFGTASVVTYKAHGQAHFTEKRPPCNDGDQANLFSQTNRATFASDDPRTTEKVGKESIPDAEFEPAEPLLVSAPARELAAALRGNSLPDLSREEPAPAPRSEASRSCVIERQAATVTLTLSDDAVAWLENEYTWEIFAYGAGAFRYREEAEVSIRGADVMARVVMLRVDQYLGRPDILARPIRLADVLGELSNPETANAYLDVGVPNSAWVVARRLNDGYTRAWKRSPSGWIFYEKGDRREL